MQIAANVMSRELKMIAATASAADAGRRMEQFQLHSLIVERSDGLDSYGIITSTDLIRKVLALGKDPAQVAVRDVMSKPIITIPPECTLFEIARLMTSNHINHLPVFDGKQLIGMVSSTDIFNIKQE